MIMCYFWTMDHVLFFVCFKFIRSVSTGIFTSKQLKHHHCCQQNIRLIKKPVSGIAETLSSIETPAPEESNLPFDKHLFLTN